jgi:hypothetical protein
MCVLIGLIISTVVNLCIASDNSWCDVEYSGKSGVVIGYYTLSSGEKINLKADCLTPSEIIESGNVLNYRTIVYNGIMKRDFVKKQLTIRLLAENNVSRQEKIAFWSAQKWINELNSAGSNISIKFVYADGNPVIELI